MRLRLVGRVCGILELANKLNELSVCNVNVGPFLDASHRRLYIYIYMEKDSTTYNDTLKLIPLDIGKAKTLLTEAGWIDTDGDNIRDKIVEGEKLQFKFKLSYMNSPTSKVIALLIKEKMYLAGILVEPTPMDFTLFYKNAQEHDFDAMLGGWGGSASYSNPMQLWHTSSWVTKGSNFCGFGDAESDALIEEANTSLDEYHLFKEILET